MGFPCYQCKNIGLETPRCNNWKSCKKYRKWAESIGIYEALLRLSKESNELHRERTKREKTQRAIK